MASGEITLFFGGLRAVSVGVRVVEDASCLLVEAPHKMSWPQADRDNRVRRRMSRFFS